MLKYLKTFRLVLMRLLKNLDYEKRLFLSVASAAIAFLLVFLVSLLRTQMDVVLSLSGALFVGLLVAV